MTQLSLIGAPYMKEPDFEELVARLRDPLVDADQNNEFDASALAALRARLNGR